MLFPEVAVLENFADNLVLIDKAYDPHSAPAWFDKLTTGFGHFKGSTLRQGSVHRFEYQFYQCRPFQPGCAAVWRIQLVNAGAVLSLRLFLLLHTALLV